MKRVFLHIIVLLVTLPAFSQTDKLDSLLNDVIWNHKDLINYADPSASFYYLYGGVAGDSKTTYAGRELEQNMVAMNGNLFFFHSKGFFIGASGIWYGQPEQRYSATIASAGMSAWLNPKKSLNGRLSYSRYFYNNSDTLQNSFTNTIGAGLSLRNKYVGARLSINLLFGNEFGFNATPAIFSRLPVIKFRKYGKVQLEPELSALFGSEFIELESTGMGSQQGSLTEPTTRETYTFLNTQIYLPVCVYIGDFDLEFGYSINIPHSSDEKYTYPSTSYFSFSLGYMISLY